MYLKGTLKLGLLYRNNMGARKGLWGYVNYDYIGDLGNKRSPTSYMFKLNGYLINWKAKL